MIVMKSIPASSITSTAYGWSRAVGSGVPSEVATYGSVASVWATARLFAAASRSTSALASAQIHATARDASTTIMTSCSTNSFVAMLQPPIHAFMPTSQRCSGSA